MKIINNLFNNIDKIKLYIFKYVKFVRNYCVFYLWLLTGFASFYIPQIKNGIKRTIFYFVSDYTVFINNSIERILLYKNKILILSVSVLFLIFSYFLIRFIFIIKKNTKVYLINFKNRIVLIRLFITGLFQLTFYKRLYINVNKNIALFMYNFLIFIWDYLKEIEVFKNPYIIRKTYFKYYKIISVRFKPFFSFFNYIRSIFLHDKGEKTETEILTLMDEGKTLTKIDIIPENIIELILNKDYSDDPIMNPAWNNIIANVIERWENNNLSGLLVNGAKGTGKTTILKYINKKYSNKFKIDYFDISRTDNILNHDMFVKFNETPLNKFDLIEKQIVIIDNIEKLFLKKIGGYDKLKNFFVIIERTKSKILWIASCNPCFVNYIQNILPINSIFRFVLDFSNFNSEYLKDFYDKKLFSIGYEYKIIPTKKQYNDTRKKIREKVISKNEINDYLKKLYFDKLIEVGDDSLDFHDFYFLRSVSTITNNKLLLTSPQFLEISYTNELSLENLFILQSFYIHKSLRKEDLVDILLMTSEEVSLSLSLLYEHNFIVKINDEFEIYSPVYYQLLKYLKMKNLL